MLINYRIRKIGSISTEIGFKNGKILYIHKIKKDIKYLAILDLAQYQTK